MSDEQKPDPANSGLALLEEQAVALATEKGASSTHPEPPEAPVEGAGEPSETAVAGLVEEFADRTRSTTEGGPRHPDDHRTHTERINGLGPGRFGDAEDMPEPVIDHDAPRTAYRTTERSIWAGVLLPPGSIVHLQPHEVGPHHVPHMIGSEEGETE